MTIRRVSQLIELTEWNGRQSRKVPTASSKVVDYILRGNDHLLTSSLVKTWYKYLPNFPTSLTFYYQLFECVMVKDSKGYLVRYTNIMSYEGGEVRISQNGLKELSRLTKHQLINNDLADMLQDLNQAVNGTY